MAGMDEVTVRKATAQDSEFAYRTKKAAFREYVEQLWGWDEDKQRELHARRFASQEFSVVRQGSEDVGVMAVSRGREAIRLNQLYIVPKHQGRGIGTVCMEKLLDEARGRGVPVRLRVLKVNARAAAFYERHGFTVSGESDTHILMERKPRS